MKIRAVTVEEVMQRIKNHENVDNYQVIHKMSIRKRDYIIRNVLEESIENLCSDEYIIVELYWEFKSPGWNMLGLLAFRH